ncbi:hypothetical protein [Eubacterium sp. 1001713B170207_170306_E7]|uniref:hypothetical protein n=1 Tax=Eubacterium sp. 1001713B170207_170306_E7 TaxID=2787097 RepID=UPI0018970F40|nr:hypothetical protein [Eubacterium sp. 1001713B170207_170306_E7]
MSLLEKDDTVISLKAELTIIQEEIIRLAQLEEKWLRLSEKTPYTRVERKKQILKQLTLIREAIDEQRRQERLLEKSLKIILEAIPKLKNIQKKVFYMQRYTGKSLVQIAEELEYDYDYIRHVAAKANQVMKRPIR